MDTTEQTEEKVAANNQVLQKVRPLLLIIGAAAFGYFIIGEIIPDDLFKGIKENYSRAQRLLLIPVMIIPIFFVIAIHELGHLITGLVQGFKFQLYVVGPLGVKRDEETDKVVVYFNKELNLAGGLAATSPTNDDPANITRFARLVIAGPLTSLLLGLLLLSIDHYFSGFVGFLLTIGGALSLVIFLVTIFPFGSSTFMSDGKRFLRLLNPETRKIEMAIMRILSTYTQNRSYERLQMDDIELMKTDSASMLHTMAYFYAYMHYLSTGQQEKAAIEAAIYREKATSFPKGLQTMMDKEIARVTASLDLP